MSKHVKPTSKDIKDKDFTEADLDKVTEHAEYALCRMAHGHVAIIRMSHKPIIVDGEEAPIVYDEVAGYGDDEQAARALAALWKA